MAQTIEDTLHIIQQNASDSTAQMGKLSKAIDGTRDSLAKLGKATSFTDALSASLKLASNMGEMYSAQLKLIENASKAVVKQTKALDSAKQAVTATFQEEHMAIQKANAARRDATQALTRQSAATQVSTFAQTQETVARAKATAGTKANIAATKLAISQTKAEAAAAKLQSAHLKANAAFLNKKAVAALNSSAAVKKSTAFDKKALVTSKAKLKADKKEIAALKLKTAWYKISTAGALKAAIAKGVKAVAMAVLNAVKKMNPIMLVVMAIVALLAVGARLISFFSRANREARDHAREVSKLSEEYSRSTEDIEADMERMGTTCRKTWKAVEDAAQNGATDFGRCADEVRGEIADLVAEYGSYEEAVASWEASQLEALGEVGSEWGMTGQEVKDALDGMTLDEWVAQQEAELDSLSDSWNMSASDIQAALQEQGITMAEWEEQQEQALVDTAVQWGLCAEDMRTSMQDMGMSLDEMTAYIENGLAEFASDVRSNVNNIANGFREIPTGMEKSAEEMRAIMDGNTAATEKWEQQLAAVYERGGEEMYQFFRDQGPQMSDAMADMLKYNDEWYAWQESIDNATRVGMDQAYQNIDCDLLSDAIRNQFDMARDSVIDNGEELGDAYENTLNDAQEQGVVAAEEGGEEIGTTYIDSAVDAIESGGDAMVAPVEAAMDEIKAAFESGMSAVEAVAVGAFTGLGTAMSQGMSNAGQIVGVGLMKVHMAFKTSLIQITATTQAKLTAIEARFVQFGNTMQTTATTSMSKFNQAIVAGFTIANFAVNKAVSGMTNSLNPLTTNMQNIGVEAMQGLNNGLQNKTATVLATARQIADGVSKTISKALDINSPSRVMMKLGEFTTDGFAKGLEDGQKGVEDIAKSTADTVTDELSKATQVQNKLQTITSKLAETKNKYADQTAAMMKAGLDSAKAVSQNMDKILADNNYHQQLALAVTPQDASYQTTLMEKLIEAVEAGKNIVMDSGELVGATYAGYDNAAGVAISYNSRWGR